MIQQSGASHTDTCFTRVILFVLVCFLMMNRDIGKGMEFGRTVSTSWLCDSVQIFMSDSNLLGRPPCETTKIPPHKEKEPFFPLILAWWSDIKVTAVESVASSPAGFVSNPELPERRIVRIIMRPCWTLGLAQVLHTYIPPCMLFSVSFWPMWPTEKQTLTVCPADYLEYFIGRLFPKRNVVYQHVFDGLDGVSSGFLFPSRWIKISLDFQSISWANFICPILLFMSLFVCLLLYVFWLCVHFPSVWLWLQR